MTFLGLIGRFCNKLFYWCLLSFDIKVLDAKQPRVKTKCLFFVAYILPLWGPELWCQQGHHHLGSKEILRDML